MFLSKSLSVARAQQLIVGTRKHFANATALAFASGSVTPAEIEASLQTLVDLRHGVEAARGTAQARLHDEVTQAPSLLRQMSAYAAFVKVTFANSPDILADFGLKPRRAATPLTVEEMATAAARRKATRAARHTMGSQQKKAVKGTITTLVPSEPHQ